MEPTDEQIELQQTEESLASKTRAADRFRIRIGAAVTLVYLLGFGTYAVFMVDVFVAMTPDRFATFLGEVLAPLVFLWLVLGFFQQGQSLWLQGEELHQSVEQQREMVTVFREQLEFEQEKIAAQLEEARRRAQPDFAFTGGAHATAGDHTIMHFKLLNRGPTCTDLRLHIEEGHVISVPYFQTGAEHPIEIQVAPTHPIGERVFRIEYVDALGNPGEDALILYATYSFGHKILELTD